MPARSIQLKTTQRCEFIDVTAQVQALVDASGVAEGLAVIQSSHTTAGVTINENADPDVAADIQATLGKLVPKEGEYRHFEHNSDSHIKTSLVGPAVTVIVSGGKLLLGRWQGIFFCDFDGPRSREIWIQVVGK